MSNVELVVAVGLGCIAAAVAALVWGASGPGLAAGVRDIAAAVAALAAAYVGVRGLSTWERQLKGNAEFECARTLAKKTYALRACIWRYRYEMQNREPEQFGTDREKLLEAYNKRWRVVVTAWEDFDVASLEAEVLWGPPARSACDALNLCAARLSNAANFYIGQKILRTAGDDDLAKVEAIVKGDGEPEDSFDRKVQDAIANIDQLVRSHLRWRHEDGLR